MMRYRGRSDREAGHPARRRRAAFFAGGLFLAGAGALLATHVPLSRNLAEYVLLARTKLQMKDFNFAAVGNIGVNDSGGNLRFGKSSNFPDGSQAASDIVSRIGDNSSLYSLFANTYNAANLVKSTIRHEGPTAWSPLPLITPLPCDATCTPGPTGVIVPKNGAASIAAGSYASIVVGNYATVTFTGDTYCLASLKAGRGAKLVFKSPDTRMRITGNLKVNPASTVGPDPTVVPALGASDVRIDVGGKSAVLSHKSRVTALIYACDAFLRFGRGSSLRGQFVANIIKSDFGSRLTLETCGDGKVDPGEQCDDGDDNGGPGSCCTATCEYVAEDTPCPDGDLCNGNEVCNATGHCLPGTPPNCNDANPCTDDTCIPATGCQNTNVTNGTPCLDDTVCNGTETCQNGTCTAGPPLVCLPPNACYYPPTCNPNAGCQFTPIPGCIPCSTTADCYPPATFCSPQVCTGGSCHGSPPPDCDDDNPCTADGCSSAAGACVHTSLDGDPCDDGDACTGNDECQDSACGGFPITCDDGDPCTENDCDPGSSSATGCFFPPIPGCGEGTLCTLTQGAYGAPGGIANKSGTGWITQNPGVFPVTVGGGGQSLTLSDQPSLVALLPCGSTPDQLDPGTWTITGGAPLPTDCDGGGVLTGQTVALSLSTALSNNAFNPTGLSSWTLPSSFCTCAGGGPSGPYTISSCILANAATVNDLLILANQALAGISLGTIDICLSYSEINAALDAINNAFDECRTVCPCGP